jgi:hypothetical protein
MQWEYFDRVEFFNQLEDGRMVSKLDEWMNDAGAEGWELVGTSPLIAPNKDGIAFGTVGVHLVFKRPKSTAAASQKA